MGADTGMNSSFVQTTMYISTYKRYFYLTLNSKQKEFFFEVVDNSVVNKFVVTEPVF